VASWAIWNSSDLNDTKIIESAISKLKPNWVFVALNFAGNGDLIFDDPKWTSWKNFHSNSKMDTRLFNVLKHPKYEGAYMTDIIKCVPAPGEKELIQMIKSGEINMEEQIKVFNEEISLLNCNGIELFLMGRATEWIFNKYASQKTKNKVKARYIVHPSPNAIRNDTTFYNTWRAELGLVMPR
jgi:hypothetical protein